MEYPENSEDDYHLLLKKGIYCYDYVQKFEQFDETWRVFKGMEHVPNIFMSFDKYLFLEVINILI